MEEIYAKIDINLNTGNHCFILSNSSNWDVMLFLDGVAENGKRVYRIAPYNSRGSLTNRYHSLYQIDNDRLVRYSAFFEDIDSYEDASNESIYTIFGKVDQYFLGATNKG